MKKKKTYWVPFAYENYGRFPVEASSEEEAWRQAEQELETMSLGEMMQYSSYLLDSETIDKEGDLHVKEKKGENQ